MTGGRSILDRGRAIGSAVLAPSLLVLLLIPFRGTVSLVADSLVLLLGVVAAALLGDLVTGLFAALLTTVLLNYYFVPPFHTFRVGDPNNVVALAVFALVAGLVTWALNQASRRRDEEVRAASLEAADAIRAALLAAVGHDLRAPLAAAKASVSSLRADDVQLSAEDTAALLDDADASLDRLASLVNSLVDLSRVQAGVMPVRLRPTPLDEVVSRALDQVGPDAAGVRVDLTADAPVVIADPGLLERALANIVENAIRFTPPGSEAVVNWREADGRVSLAVVDHGPGVRREDFETMFRPFQRLGDSTNTEGLGLGLALARGLVEAMGGAVEPEETPGGGLTMMIRLELAA